MGLHGSSLSWFGSKRTEGERTVSTWCKRSPSYDYNWTDLHYAASRGDLHKLNILLQATDPASYDTKDFYGKTPLYWAAYKGHRACMERLIGHGADVNSRCKHGSTPLHAVIGLYPDCATLLVQHGADVNQADKWGVTPMYLAACNGQLDGLRLLVHAGAVMTYRNKKTGEVPKQLAPRAAVVSWLEGRARAPRSLKHLARAAIGRHLAPRPRLGAVRRLRLPAALERYMMFDELAQCGSDEGQPLPPAPACGPGAAPAGEAGAGGRT